MRPMIERVTDYPGYLIRFRPEKPSRQAILLFHGFPAYRATKNLDLAERLHHHFQRDVFLLHYRGLGESRGVFRFTEAIREAYALVDRLVEKEGFEPLAIVGHSFGGLVALNTAAEKAEKVRTAILLSPLCDLDPQQDLYTWILRGVREELPGVYGDRSEAAVLADLETIRSDYSPMKKAPSLAPHLRLGFIQALQDDTTPASATRALVARFAAPPPYLELDLDHSFTQDRARLVRELIALQEKLEG